MGCCLAALIGALWPRVVLICLWFMDIPGRVFHSTLWPLLGFVFLPTTTLAYELIKFKVGSIDNPWIVLLALAFLHDLGQLRIFRGPRQPMQSQGSSKHARYVDPE